MPPRLLLDTLRRFTDLAATALWPPRGGCARRTLRHYATVLPLLAALPLYLVYHWVGLLLDELLFPGYRRIRVRAPLFVLGVPRSGTTAVHRTLAADPRFTTFSTWECLFGLAITWRHAWGALARVDRAAGRPGGRLLDRLEMRLARGLEGIHAVRRDAPEEDYLAFLPVLACFILVVPFPDARSIWRLGRLDEALPPAERERLLRFHYRCVQRHLHFHGADCRFLSKNAAFAPLVGSLLETYPDARVLGCLRAPEGAVSSQLAALDPGLRGFHGSYRRAEFRDRMVDLLGFYYRNLLDRVSVADGRAALMPAAALRADLAGTVLAALARVDGPVPAASERVVRAAVGSGADGPRHRHALEDFGLSTEQVARRFEDVHARFDFSARVPVQPGGPGATGFWRAA
jgi:hypothetical protein